MKTVTLVLAILAVALTANAFVDRRPLGTRNGPRFPTFPGQGPFNPGYRLPDAYNRHRREVDVDELPVISDDYTEKDTEYALLSDPRLFESAAVREIDDEPRDVYGDNTSISEYEQQNSEENLPINRESRTRGTQH